MRIVFNNPMPPRRSSSKPRSYGRQAEGKTIKSLSLDSELALWAEAWAARHGKSFSQAVNEALRLEKKRQEKERLEPVPGPDSAPPPAPVKKQAKKGQGKEKSASAPEET